MKNLYQKYWLGLVILAIIVLYLLKVFVLTPATLVTIIGNGKVKVKPTLVKFSFSLSTLAPSASEAIAKNTTIFGNLIAILKNSGVSNQEINLSVVRVIPPQTTSGQTNYQALNMADVSFKNVNQLDSLISQLYQAGAQSITNLTFTTQNSGDLEKQAVALAITDAKKRAKEIAKASGKFLGRMVSISTSAVGEAGALSGEAGEASTPSLIEINRQASIIFELR